MWVARPRSPPACGALTIGHGFPRLPRSAQDGGEVASAANVVERGIGKLWFMRAVATRYDKRDGFLGQTGLTLEPEPP